MNRRDESFFHFSRKLYNRKGQIDTTGQFTLGCAVWYIFDARYSDSIAFSSSWSIAPYVQLAAPDCPLLCPCIGSARASRRPEAMREVRGD